MGPFMIFVACRTSSTAWKGSWRPARTPLRSCWMSFKTLKRRKQRETGEAIFYFGGSVYITRLKGNACTLTLKHKSILINNVSNSVFVRLLYKYITLQLAYLIDIRYQHPTAGISCSEGFSHLRLISHRQT